MTTWTQIVSHLSESKKYLPASTFEEIRKEVVARRMARLQGNPEAPEGYSDLSSRIEDAVSKLRRL